MSRSARGRTAHLGGLSAEAVVARRYREMGGEILAERWRGPEGEIDLVVRLDALLVFVEVKRRRNAAVTGPQISSAQWKRLEATALRYMLAYQDETGIQPFCRFDVALMDHAGEVRIFENARSFDEQ